MHERQARPFGLRMRRRDALQQCPALLRLAKSDEDACPEIGPPGSGGSGLLLFGRSPDASAYAPDFTIAYAAAKRSTGSADSPAPARRPDVSGDELPRTRSCKGKCFVQGRGSSARHSTACHRYRSRQDDGATVQDLQVQPPAASGNRFSRRSALRQARQRHPRPRSAGMGLEHALIPGDRVGAAACAPGTAPRRSMHRVNGPLRAAQWSNADNASA